MRALCTCVRVYTVVYVRVCVRYVLVRVCARTCEYVCVCVRVRVHACACEGIEDDLPLGVLPPQERASLQAVCPLEGRLKKLSWPVPVHAC